MTATTPPAPAPQPASAPLFAHVAIIGCGLMGGSLALALRRAGLAGRISGSGADPAALQWAQQQGVIDRACPSPAQAVQQADLVVLAVPVAAMQPVLHAIAPHIPAHCIITDVGSTKQNIITYAQQALGADSARFVPAHPIAGKEHAGIQYADAALYHGRQVILTPPPHIYMDALHIVHDMWGRLGCIVHTMSAQAHDAAFAGISHLPHLLAFAFMQGLLQQPQAEQTLALGGSGFRDFSRIAAGDAAMWRDIFLCNRDDVLVQTRAFSQALHTFTQAIEQGQADALYQLISQASQARAGWHMTTRDDNARL